MTLLLPRLRYPAAALLAAALAVAALPAHSEEADAEIDINDIVQAGPEMPGADSDLDWSALNIDALTLLENPSARMVRGKISAAPSDTIWSSRDNPNGSSAVTVKRSVSPFWDTRIGADLSVARDNPNAFTQTRPETFQHNFQPWDRTERSTGTAWASMTAPGIASIWDKTAIEARVDPFEDRSKLGTSLSKSLPLGNNQYTLTLQNGFNVQQQGLIPGLPVTGHGGRTYEVDRAAKLNINQSGTSLMAGQTLSTADDRWLRKFGAEQKLFGGVNVTGSVSQTPDGLLNKSFSAGFKHTW